MCLSPWLFLLEPGTGQVQVVVEETWRWFSPHPFVPLYEDSGRLGNWPVLLGGSQNPTSVALE